MNGEADLLDGVVAEPEGVLDGLGAHVVVDGEGAREVAGEVLGAGDGNVVATVAVEYAEQIEVLSAKEAAVDHHVVLLRGVREGGEGEQQGDSEQGQEERTIVGRRPIVSENPTGKRTLPR